MKESAGTAVERMKWLLGDKLISMQVVVVSLSLSIASIGIFFGMFTFRNPPFRRSGTILVISGGLHLLYGLLAARVFFRKGRRFIPLVLMLILTSLCTLFYVADFFAASLLSFLREPDGRAILILTLVWGLGAAAFGFVCDFLLLAVNRLLIDAMARTNRKTRLVLGLAFNLLWFFVLIESLRFMLYANPTNKHDPFLALLSHLLGPVLERKLGFVVHGAILIGLWSNVFNLIASCSVLLVFLAALFHRLFWPLAGRAIFALYEWRVFTNRTFQLAASVAFLSYAFPWLDPALKMFKLK